MNKRYEVNFVNEKIGCGETYKTFYNKAKAIAFARELLTNHGSEAGDYVEVCDNKSEFYDTIFRKEYSK